MRIADKIAHDYLSKEFSIDAIIGKYRTKQRDSDDILKIIKVARWEHYKKTGEKI